MFISIRNPSFGHCELPCPSINWQTICEWPNSHLQKNKQTKTTKCHTLCYYSNVGTYNALYWRFVFNQICITSVTSSYPMKVCVLLFCFGGALFKPTLGNQHVLLWNVMKIRAFFNRVFIFSMTEIEPVSEFIV